MKSRQFKDKKGNSNRKEYRLSLEKCFEFIEISDQIDICSFTCKVCNERVKPDSIKNKMVTLPKYLVFCLFKDKNDLNSINYEFSYGKEIELSPYFKYIEGYDKSPSTKYKFQCGCYSRANYNHSVAFCVHFDDYIYEFNDSYYFKNDNEEEAFKALY